jgi:hypothetical protein
MILHLQAFNHGSLSVNNLQSLPVSLPTNTQFISRLSIHIAFEYRFAAFTKIARIFVKLNLYFRLVPDGEASTDCAKFAVISGMNGNASNEAAIVFF